MNAAVAAELTDRKAVAGLTYTQISELSGVSLRQVKRIFNDERAADIGELERVSRALGVSMHSVMSGALARLEKGERI